MELFGPFRRWYPDEILLKIREYPMTDSVGSKNGNGHASKETSAMSAASAKASSTGSDVQDDVQALREDVAKLTQQLADLAAAKGAEMWGNARAKVDGVFDGVSEKAGEATDAMGEVRDNLAGALDESLENRPYTTLALSLAAGFVLGALWKR
jgi:ElaB/YqjD/DUF883 family membrane-anchored ribosome-binding protein